MRIRPFLALVGALAVSFWAPSPARATLQLKLFDNGVLITGAAIMDNGPGDADLTIGSIDAAAVINGLITNFHFTSLGATSTNVPVGATDANLTQSIQVTSTVGGGGTIVLQVTDTSFPLPTHPVMMISTASGSSTAVTSLTQGFNSWFNPTNAPFAMDIPAPPISLSYTGTVSHSDTTTTAIPDLTPFGLTNEMTFTLEASTAGITRKMQTSGSTIIEGAAVPEPATVIGVVSALPLLAFGVWRRRKTAS